MTKSNYISFIAGIAVGSVCMWVGLKRHYAEITQEEINSVKEQYGKLYSDDNVDYTDDPDVVKKIKENSSYTPYDQPIDNRNKPDMMTYARILAERRYGNSDSESVSEKKEPSAEHPYVISPEEFGEDEEYEQISLTYYADKVLADENDDPIENIDEVVGTDSLNHFGEYEDDSVFVRNDKLKSYFEILMCYKTYSEIAKTKPHPKGEKTEE